MYYNYTPFQTDKVAIDGQLCPRQWLSMHQLNLVIYLHLLRLIMWSMSPWLLLYLIALPSYFTRQVVTHQPSPPLPTSFYVQPRVHSKRREGECPTLIIPCTNALCKVCTINHRVLMFCINTSGQQKT